MISGRGTGACAAARLGRPQPLLGATRVTDLAVNVILPWFWMRAEAGRNEPLRKMAEERYRAWPAAQDNAPLRLARRRLLGRGGSAGTPLGRQRSRACCKSCAIFATTPTPSARIVRFPAWCEDFVPCE